MPDKLQRASAICTRWVIFSAVIAGSFGCSGPRTAAAVSPGSIEPEAWRYGLPRIAQRFTTGGRGGQIIRVSTLASDGPGTLRAALAAEGRRVIVFDIAGTIDLAGANLVVTNPYVTVAGQTAPSPGITIVRGGLIIRGHDVVVQHLRVRPGDLGEAPRSGRDIDAITTMSASNVIVDHCTLTWATDENLSASGPRFTGDGPDAWRAGTSRVILYSNNIIAEGLANSTHAKGEHSKGSLIHDNASGIVIYRNLYSSNFERSPLFKGGVRGAIINNLIYNPGQRAVQYNLQGLEWGDVPFELGQMDLIGNVLRAGPSTVSGLPLLMFGGEGNLSLFVRDNIAVDRWGRDLPTLGRYTVSPSDVVAVDKPHMSFGGEDILPARGLEAVILSGVGARPWDRDAHDVRILADVAEGRGQIIDSQSQVGGYPKHTPRKRPFVPANWNLESLTPKTDKALDSAGRALGT